MHIEEKYVIKINKEKMTKFYKEITNAAYAKILIIIKLTTKPYSVICICLVKNLF